MILFLDFDGVLHGLGRPLFEHLVRFEAFLREFPEIEIVISSSWREDHSLAALRKFFSNDLHARIIDTTPIITTKTPPYPRHVRHLEIQQYVTTKVLEPQQYLALDDDPVLFPADCPYLILCEPVIGCDDELVDVLRARMVDLTGLERLVTAYAVAGELSLMLNTGEILAGCDPEGLAEALYARGFRSNDVHFASEQERRRVQCAGQIGALKRKLRQIAKAAES